MKKIENNFVVTGFVGKDAEIRQFSTASVARFSLERRFLRQAHQGSHDHCRGLLQA